MNPVNNSANILLTLVFCDLAFPLYLKNEVSTLLPFPLRQTTPLYLQHTPT